jgi:hypothetical protein
LRVRVAGFAGSLATVFSVAAGSLFLAAGAFFVVGTGALRTLDAGLGASSTAGSSATAGFCAFGTGAFFTAAILRVRVAVGLGASSVVSGSSAAAGASALRPRVALVAGAGAGAAFVWTLAVRAVFVATVFLAMGGSASSGSALALRFTAVVFVGLIGEGASSSTSSTAFFLPPPRLGGALSVLEGAEATSGALLAPRRVATMMFIDVRCLRDVSLSVWCETGSIELVDVLAVLCCQSANTY